MRFAVFLCCSVRCFYVFLCGFGVFVTPLSPPELVLFFFFSENPAGIMLKTEPIRKLSNFNFYWTKTLYPSNLNKITYFLHFSRAIDISNNCNNAKDSWEPVKINVKFCKNCENTGKILKISCVLMSFCEI